MEDKLRSTKENAQGILSKARGYCARIAMVIHSLELALELLSILKHLHHCLHQNHQLGIQMVRAASAIIHHFNNHKFIMLGLADDCSDTSESLLSNRMTRLLTMNCKSDSDIITPSEVSQKHISERVGVSHPTSKAIEILEEGWAMEPLLTSQHPTSAL